MLEASHRYFHKGADLFDLEDKLRSILLTPNRIVKAELAFEGADGKIHHHIGYRAQHSNRRGPYKGGLRYHPAMDEDHAVALARRIRAKGFADVEIRKRTSASGFVYSVNVGAFDTRQEAHAQQQELVAAGFKPAFVRP